MISVSKFITTILILLILSSAALAGDKGDDKWFAADKLKHFGFSAFLSGGTFTVARKHFDYSQNESFAVSVGITISLGGAKEIIDSKSPNQTSSYKDFIWDIAGAAVGALLASSAI
jgi:putative lipoprotein